MIIQETGYILSWDVYVIQASVLGFLQVDSVSELYLNLYAGDRENESRQYGVDLVHRIFERIKHLMDILRVTVLMDTTLIFGIS